MPISILSSVNHKIISNTPKTSTTTTTIYSNVLLTPNLAFTSNTVTITGQTGINIWQNGTYTLTSSPGDLGGGYYLYNCINSTHKVMIKQMLDFITL